ncbi:hypothetical protein [Thermomonospora cellulosilytica]|uniref:Uncharacterized protein n=1 Tax=Thermomonospora cellulosilytica TaxID=1411118 RepID=A0A7W3MU82_9ACTN|nr:hypothetical protein [Thermomonospora cellulosilytica]MBA9002015.1 hypothetical protein [Thermomonospora cellulosilytica]
MATLITVEQLLARPGFDGVDEATAEAVLEDVSALVSLIAAPVELTAATLPSAVVPVIVSMARRGLSNPRGLSGEQLGDYGWQAGGQTSSGVYATRHEERIIRRAVGRLGASNATLNSDLPLPPERAGGGGFENEFLNSL